MTASCSYAFNVYDRDLDLSRHWLLEASAGTGKTFAIQNLVIRWLCASPMEGDDPVGLRNILVVTFTRAATRQLKDRLFSSLVATRNVLSSLLKKGAVEDMLPLPDYLQAIGEQGEMWTSLALSRVEGAIACFDEAQIFTIHGFCHRMLNQFNGNGLGLRRDDKSLSFQTFSQVLRDVLRCEVPGRRYSVGQLRRILGKYRENFDLLAVDLYRRTKEGGRFPEAPDFSTSWMRFQEALAHVKADHSIGAQEILDDFTAMASLFREVCDKSNQPKAEAVLAARRCAQLFSGEPLTPAFFDELVLEGLSLSELFDPVHLKKKIDPSCLSSFRLPDLLKEINRRLKPIVDEARCVRGIQSRLEEQVRRLLRLKARETGALSPQMILEAMSEAIQDQSFVARLRDQYRLVIVDEFQDTDPLQWNILKSAFLDGRTKLCLVGDPKQSIYSFRKGDVYTYLEAYQNIGTEYRASLETNYRSEEALVQALNRFFSEPFHQGWLSLPRLGRTLPFAPVGASQSVPQRICGDQKGHLHFFLAKGEQGRGSRWPTEKMEQRLLFPFIAEEIARLRHHSDVAFGECAVLVKDRYQAQALSSFLEEHHIPSVLQRTVSVAESECVQEMKALIAAILEPTDDRRLSSALATRLLGWRPEALRRFRDALSSDPCSLEPLFGKFLQLRECLLRQGLAACFRDVLRQDWIGKGVSAEELLLQRPEGKEAYADYDQLLELMVDFQRQKELGPERLLEFFPYLDGCDEEDERLQLRRPGNQKAVSVLTLHKSKGLEFGVVFALCAGSRSPANREEGSFGEEENVVEERDAETLRQLYVAATRARHRLYLPLLFDSDQKPISPGCASALELYFASRESSMQASRESVTQRAAALDASTVEAALSELESCASVSFDWVHPAAPDFAEVQEALPRELSSPRLPPARPAPCRLYSYSKLLRQMAASSHFTEDLESRGTNPASASEDRSPLTLPSGAAVGEALHALLERVSFESIRRAESPKDLQEVLGKEKCPFRLSGDLEGWEEVVCEMFFDAFKTPLWSGEGAFSLSEISESQMYREMEFLYPSSSGHYLSGVVDLFFRHKGRYYFVDYKSNCFSVRVEDYTSSRLWEAMRTHSYDLQASIYAEAIKRYLSLVEKRPFEDCFGGAFYLFLRGMSPKYGGGHGVVRLGLEEMRWTAQREQLLR